MVSTQQRFVLRKALYTIPCEGGCSAPQHTISVDPKKHGKSKKIFIVDVSKSKKELPKEKYKEEPKNKQIFVIDNFSPIMFLGNKGIEGTKTLEKALRYCINLDKLGVFNKF